MVSIIKYSSILSSSLNSADLLFRECMSQDLSEVWFNGHVFLALYCDLCSEFRSEAQVYISSEDVKIRRAVTMASALVFVWRLRVQA